MNDTGTATARPLAFVLALGAIGGATLIGTTLLSTRGPLILLPYAGIVLVTAFFFRAEAVQPASRRFTLGLGAFMTATVILYLFIATVPTHGLVNISIVGHLWRLGAMLLIGAILSAAVAQLTATSVDR